jgi:hypothetical protein
MQNHPHKNDLKQIASRNAKYGMPDGNPPYTPGRQTRQGNARFCGHRANITDERDFRGAKMVRLEWTDEKGLRKWNGRQTYGQEWKSRCVQSKTGKTKHYYENQIEYVRYSNAVGFEVIRLKQGESPW